MPYSANDARLLSHTLANALEILRSSARRSLSEGDTAHLYRRMVECLMGVFDLGEPEASALLRAALDDIRASRANA